MSLISDVLMLSALKRVHMQDLGPNTPGHNHSRAVVGELCTHRLAVQLKFQVAQRRVQCHSLHKAGTVVCNGSGTAQSASLRHMPATDSYHESGDASLAWPHEQPAATLLL